MAAGRAKGIAARIAADKAGGMEAGVMKLMGDIRAGNFFISFASNAFYF